MNMAEGLAREIYRVARLMRSYEEIGDVGKPALHMMNASLEAAFKAAGSNDVLAVINAYSDLKAYKE